MEILVGCTGFVGSNLYAQHYFDGTFNSKNIAAAFGTQPELCVYAGVRAEKFLANKDPKQDMAVIENAIENIKKINPKRLVLISTIDVFKSPNGADELTPICIDGLNAYGYNRYILEQWVKENVAQHHIVRLPGLFGKNIKKNFIYDLIHVIPAMLSEPKYKELAAADTLIALSYERQQNGFYRCTVNVGAERGALRRAFERVGFSALNFTDSRAVYQFYNLAYLWGHIETAMQNSLDLLHLAVEPCSAGEVYSAITGLDFSNELDGAAPIYDYRTNYAEFFAGKGGYIIDKQQVLRDITAFVKAEQQNSDI